MKLCLNMIVKNESARIVRALDSVSKFIDCYAIVDTGSEDDTRKIIQNYFVERNIPGYVSRAPFEDWSQARNAGLMAARALRVKWDYAILMDADMQLIMNDFEKFKAALSGGLSYDMEQRTATLRYLNRRVIGAHATGLYKGVTHEYLDVHSAGTIAPDVAHFLDHADGANRPEKYKRDIRLLLDGLEKEPDNSRYYFYLAQSYRDAGDLDNAMKWYKRRVEAGGWIEEQWNAQVNYAHCHKDKGDEAGFVREMLMAYNMRPSRAETMYDLARYFREKPDKQAIAALFAAGGMRIPKSTDALFVNDFVYESGLKEEFAISAFYNEQTRLAGFEVCDKLSLQPGPYHTARASARANLFHYIPTLSNFCPSFDWKKIAFEPPEGWTCLNPSVTVHQGALRAVVRTVNYRIDEQGRYLIRATDGTANATNPINTRNYLVSFDDQLAMSSVDEILPPRHMPCEFNLVIGFEDMRLFSWKDALWTSSTVRQLHWDGNCEQVLAKVAPDAETFAYRLTDMWRMLREPRVTEKNWSPIVNEGELTFMHRPGVVVDKNGATVRSNPPVLTTDIISGGSQLVKFGPGWLSLVHTANPIPNSPCRYYFHRFAFYDQEFRLATLSRPFVFHEKVIEFAAGMCEHPADSTKLVISYGFKDAEARIATITQQDVMRFLWAPLVQSKS